MGSVSNLDEESWLGITRLCRCSTRSRPRGLFAPVNSWHFTPYTYLFCWCPVQSTTKREGTVECESKLSYVGCSFRSGGGCNCFLLRVTSLSF